MALKLKGISPITNWWKRTFMEEDRVMPTMMLTEDFRIVDSTLPVKKGHTLHETSRMAWMIDSGNLVKDMLATGQPQFMQVICERAVNPLALWQDPNKKITEADIDKIAEQTTDQAIEEAGKKANTNRNLWMMMAGIIFVGICLLIAMFAKSGIKL